MSARSTAMPERWRARRRHEAYLAFPGHPDLVSRQRRLSDCDFPAADVEHDPAMQSVVTEAVSAGSFLTECPLKRYVVVRNLGRLCHVVLSGRRALVKAGCRTR